MITLYPAEIEMGLETSLQGLVFQHDDEVQEILEGHPREEQNHTVGISPNYEFSEVEGQSSAACLDNYSVPIPASAIRVEKEWVTLDGNKMIWLHVEYRARYSVVYKSILAM